MTGSTSINLRFKNSIDRKLFFGLAILIGIFSACIFFMNCILHFFPLENFLAHDEAEHLRIIFGFDRGEFPYRDYNENHPISFHIAISYLKSWLGLQTLNSVYYFIKALVFLHFFGVIAIIIKILFQMRSNLKLRLPISLTVLVAVSSLGIWNFSTDWIWGMNSIWQIRPDWFSCFYLSLSVMFHFSMLQQLFEMRTLKKLSFTAAASAICLLISVVILPKFIYLLGPYCVVLVLWTIGQFFEKSENYDKAYFRFQMRRMILVHVLICALFFFGLAIVIFFETHFIGLQFRDYFYYVYVLNSKKHIASAANSSDFSPWNVLREISPFNFYGFFFLLVFYIGRLRHLARYQDFNFEYGLLLFCGLIFIFNMAVPAFFNGIIWPWYFLYSIIGFIFLIVLTLNIAFNQKYTLIKVLVALFIAIQLGVHLKRTLIDFKNSAIVSCLQGSGEICYTQLLRERPFPEDLTYLAVFSETIPLKARVWGYYNLGVYTENFWNDFSELHLGPNPEKAFRSHFDYDPPQAVIVDSQHNFLRYLDSIYSKQKIDLYSVYPIFVKNYLCYSKETFKLFILKTLEGKFQAQGWTECPENRYDKI